MSWLEFKCPVCGCTAYQRVVVPRPPHAPYETEFHCCLGCSLMFVEPELFTSAPNFEKEVPPRRPGGAPDAMLHSESIRARFWMARAKRENGGYQPTPEQMLKVRDRYRQ